MLISWRVDFYGTNGEFFEKAHFVPLRNHGASFWSFLV